MEFIFNGIDEFSSIQSQLLYTELQKSEKSITGIGFLNKTRNFLIDYIMISEAYVNQLGLRNISLSLCKKNGFERIYQSDDIVIFKNTSNRCGFK